ncbi:selenocysteine synthase family protein [Mycobacterium avium subsp. avium 2285 (R)]|nr:selenocysteine synthase family protein [Mycobacterium avium subsp. avium 2285 (R)]
MPGTDTLLADPRLAAAQRVLGRALVKSVITQAQQRARAGEISPEQVAEHALAALPATASSLRPVINATGVVVHTNLGRAPLSRAALDAVVAAGGATDVEFDLATGRRPAAAGARWPRWPARYPRPAACTSSTTTRPRCCWSP